MSKRFIFFFLSTFIMLSVYFTVENTFSSTISSVDSFLNTTLYIFDYILFAGYLFSKYQKNKKLSLLTIVLAFSLLLVYSYIETHYLIEKNNTIWSNFFFAFHILARIFIFIAFLFEIKLPKKFMPKNILINILLIIILIFCDLQIIQILGVAKYDFKYHVVLYIVEMFILNLALLKPTTNKKFYYIFIVSAIFSIFNNYFSIQNQIYFSPIYKFPITQIGITLAELGLVYSIIYLAKNSVFLKLKLLNNDNKTIFQKNIFRR